MRTTATLIDQVRILSNIPDSQQKFTNQQILDVANNELIGYVLPLLMNCREEFYVFEHEVPVNASNKYRIPSRAVASKLRDVKLRRAGNDQEIYDLARVAEEDVLTERSSQGASPEGFYLQGAFIRIYPQLDSGSGDTILAPFFLRPNKLVELSTVGVITAIDTTTNTVTVAGVPTTITAGSKVDLVKQNGQYDTMQFDLVVSSINASNIVLPSTLPEDLEVGDYITPAETAPVAQIPEEWYPLFTDRIICRIQQSQNDVEAFKIAQEKMLELDEKAKDLATPRIEGESEILFNRNWNQFGSW